METSFSDRNNFLNFILFLFIGIIFAGCTENKNYPVEPVSVESRIFNFDSSYTEVLPISTGRSDILVCGGRDGLKAYSLIRFDSLSTEGDSIVLELIADSTSLNLGIYSLKREWDEDSIYTWDDSLIDFKDTLKMFNVNSENPRITIDTTETELIDALIGRGVGLYTDRYYEIQSRSSGQGPELITLSAGGDESFSCSGDQFVVDRPQRFTDSIIGDSLFVGRGLLLSSHVFIPVDSLPEALLKNPEHLSKGVLLFPVSDDLNFDVTAFSEQGEGYYLFDEKEDTLEFDIREVFSDSLNNDFVELAVEPTVRAGGLGVKKLSKNFQVNLIWVVFEND